VKGITRVVAASATMLTAGALSCVYLYARLQPGGGYLTTDSANLATSNRRRMSLRSWLASTTLARQTMRFRMRDGSSIRSRIVDGGGLLSVYVDHDYDVPGVDWPAARTIVDIGAHVGSFTVWAARRSPRARLVAVEPNPETFQLLTQNIRDNGLQDRVITVNSAIAAAPGIGSLELVEHSLGTRLARGTGTGHRVNVQTLAELLADAGLVDVDLLKMDCEGREYEVFEAIGSELLRSVRVLACEYHPEPNRDVEELDRMLHWAGFKVQRPDSRLGVLWATR
jgi:FkbM family methyltransferase